MKKPTIFINGRFLTKTVTGVQRYATELVLGLDRLLEQGELDAEAADIIVLAPQQVQAWPQLRHIRLHQVGRLQGVAWEQLELPFYARNGLLWNPCNAVSFLARKQIATIHDAAVYAVPQNYTRLYRWWSKLNMGYAALADRTVLTVSKFSGRELTRYSGIKEERIHVIYEGWEHMHGKPEAAGGVPGEQELLPIGGKPFALAVSSMTPNKNFTGIMKAIQWLQPEEFEMVLVGGADPRIYTASGLKQEKGIRYLGYVDDRQLRQLYREASCFVFPSFYEGFGLPPLEAMSLGCPVLVSDRGALPEICGDAALYCNPGDWRDIGKKIRLMMENPWLREELRRKGLTRIQAFSWETCARETFRVLEQEVRGASGAGWRTRLMYRREAVRKAKPGPAGDK